MADFSFYNLCAARRSVHDFVAPPQCITDAQMNEIMQSVRLSPSGYNAQPWHFILVRDPKQLAALQAISFDQAHITTAGNVVLVCANTHFGVHEHDRIIAESEAAGMADAAVGDLSRSLRKDRPSQQKTLMAVRNTMIGATTFLYAAAAHGWATCPMMGFSQRRVGALLGLPHGWVPCLMIALGREDTSKTPPRLPRKPADQLWSSGTFGTADS